MFLRTIAVVFAIPIVAFATAFILDRIFTTSSAVWAPDPIGAEGGAVKAGSMQNESTSIIVNKHQPLSADHVPADLVIPDIPFSFNGKPEKRYLRKPAADAVEALFAAAKKDGIELFGVSGYRSYNTQRWLWNYNVRKKGEAAASRYNASPGMSEHQTGLALDVSSESVGLQLTEPFGDTKEGLWLADNAHRFGFILRYPEGKEQITGYSYEPWHIRYVGTETAGAIYKNKLTLEEWANGSVATGGFQIFPFNLF